MANEILNREILSLLFDFRAVYVAACESGRASTFIE